MDDRLQAVREEIGRLLEESREFDFNKSNSMVAATRWWQRCGAVLETAAELSTAAQSADRRFKLLLLPTVRGKISAVVLANESQAVLFRTGLHHVVMLLVDADEALHGRTGPPGLSGAELHHWVWNDRTAALWADSHFASAVSVAASRIEEELAHKLGTGQSGTKLAAQAFNPADPTPGQRRLRVPNCGRKGTERWKSAQGGAMYLGMGVMEYIRNRFAHESGTTSEARAVDHVEALHYLVTLSTYARIVDTAKVTTPTTRARTGKTTVAGSSKS